MNTLSKLGTIIQVNLWDDLSFRVDKKTSFLITDRSAFQFMVEGQLYESGKLFGLYGKIMSGHKRYQQLICNVIVRADNSNWECSSQCQANVKIGPGVIQRNIEFDYRHPDGTRIKGFPVLNSIGEIIALP